MKKLSLTFALVLGLFLSINVKAQTAPNYFIGKWDVLLKGLPQGDAHILFKLADSAGHLKGVLVDTTAAHKDIPLTKVEQDGDKITMYFTAQGYDVSLLLAKKDDDHVSGSLMSMFDAVGTRIKEK